MSTTQHYYQTAGHVIAAGMVLSVMDVIALVLRFRARIESKQPLMADDWLLLPATLMVIGVGSCLVYGVQHEAFGYRQYPTSKDAPSIKALNQMSMSIKLEWSISIILPIALACTKISVLLFYKRIFAISQTLKRLMIAFIVFIVLWALAFVLATLLCCGTMLFAIWKPISEMAMCMFFLDVLMGFCITGFVTDLVLIAIPLPVIWRLKLSTHNKIIASATFLLGSVTLAASLARLIISVGFVQEAANPKKDFILNTTLYCYWAMVEVSVGVFAACLPTLKPFFRSKGWQSVASKTRSLFGS
ncbi:hypothetical protein DM02DRAFT_509961, partial [Periconia macrospinosa]